jgi:hypothetical protein
MAVVVVAVVVVVEVEVFVLNDMETFDGCEQ